MDHNHETSIKKSIMSSVNFLRFVVFSFDKFPENRNPPKQSKILKLVLIGFNT